MPLSSFLLLIPATYLSVALVPRRGDRPGWGLSLAATAAAVLVALTAAVTLLAGAQASVSGGGILATRLDGLTVTMLLLVTAIAGLILRFSRRYLDGESGLERYQRWFLATMAATTLLVVTNHLLVLALAWIATSLALHQLLTFYEERPQALVAAHKKFLLSRLADLAILSGVVLLARATDTYAIDRMVAIASGMATTPTALGAGAVLLVLGVLLRTAQLPFHGWLIQVMEAPTPVSALLHAGIVNIGGFVMIRLGGLMVQAEVAQLILVVVGTLTAVLAALVMTTRVSIKVALAWSTCAQMGFMLIECGLGAYELALLHLVAHSLYKAHGFLSSGRVVEQRGQRSLAPTMVPASLSGLLAAAAGSLVAIGGLTFALGIHLAAAPTTAAIAVIAALAIAPLALRAARAPMGLALRLVGAIVALGTTYGLAHAMAGTIAARLAGDATLAWVRSGIVIAGFVTLYLVQAVLLARPTGGLARALYPACFAGFYLDEIFTRLTFQLWPPRAPAALVSAARTTSPITMERAA